MAFQQGSPITPQLGAVDFSEMRRGAAQASRSIMEGTGRAAQLRAEAGAAVGQTFADIGNTMAQSIEKFIDKKEEKKREEAAVNLLQSFATSELEKTQQQMGAAMAMPEFQQPQPGQLESVTAQQIREFQGGQLPSIQEEGRGTVLRPDTTAPAAPRIGSIESIGQMADTAEARRAAAFAQQQFSQRTQTLRQMAMDPSIAKEAVKSVGPAAAIDFIMGRVASDQAAAQQQVENRQRQRSLDIDQFRAESAAELGERELTLEEKRARTNRLQNQQEINILREKLKIKERDAERKIAISKALGTSFTDGKFDVEKFTNILAENEIAMDESDFGYVIQVLTDLSRRYGSETNPDLQQWESTRDRFIAAYEAGEMNLKGVGTKLINEAVSLGFVTPEVGERLITGGRDVPTALTNGSEPTHVVFPKDLLEERDLMNMTEEELEEVAANIPYVGDQQTLELLFGQSEQIDILPYSMIEGQPKEPEEEKPESGKKTTADAGTQPTEEKTPSEDLGLVSPEAAAKRAREGATREVEPPEGSGEDFYVSQGIMSPELRAASEIAGRVNRDKPISFRDTEGRMGEAGEVIVVNPGTEQYEELKTMSPQRAYQILTERGFEVVVPEPERPSWLNNE